MPARLLYTGQVVVDLVMGLDHLPVSGGDVLASSAEFASGGGFNVMAAAARNDMQVVYLGRHGTGRFGDLARAAMHAEGIHVANQADPSQDTGLSVALIEPSAERSFISYVGAEGVLTPADLLAVEAASADYVFVSGYSLLHAGKVDALLDWLTTLPAETQVMFDPGPLVTSALLPAVVQLLPRIDLWSSNREEAVRFCDCTSIDQALAQLPALLAPNALVVIRDGSAGCWLGGRVSTRQVGGFAVTAIDTNGAGDAHAGILVAALAAGYDAPQAAQRANAGAALAVTQWGPATAPRATHIDQWILDATHMNPS